MIPLTRLNRTPLFLNSDLIEHIEAAPDTVVSLLNGQKLLVLETPEDIIERVIQFRQAVTAQPFSSSRKGPSENGCRLVAWPTSGEASSDDLVPDPAQRGGE
jgi:flagellar protein FlbD